MTYRTKTYIAADWHSDKDAVEQLRKWNDSEYWGLSFRDAHEMTQARDTSLNCSIKRSLASRLNASKTFVLIIGNNTNSVKSGSCQYCQDYYADFHICLRNNAVDLRSYIEYECEKAVRDGLKIIVLYKSFFVYKQKCPEVIRNYGTHIPMYSRDNEGMFNWNYQAIKTALK